MILLKARIQFQAAMGCNILMSVHKIKLGFISLGENIIKRNIT